MAFWEGILGSWPKSTTGTANHRIDEITELKMQLIDLGYNPLEVDYMVTIHSRGVELERLDGSRLETIVEALRAQLAVAQQCVQAVRRT